VKPPAAAVVGHLVWSRTGRVWAVWRVPGMSYIWLPQRRKLAEHSRIRALLAALPAESMILSVAARLDPGEVVEAMTDGVDLHVHPGWADVVVSALDRLEQVDLYRRRHYLCVQLPDAHRGGQLRAWWRAVSSSMSASFGLVTQPIPASALVAATRQAAEVEARLRTVPLERCTAGEIAWLYARAARRGLDTEPPLAGWPEPLVRTRWLPRGDEPVVVPAALTSFVEGVHFRQGGDRRDEDRPWHRRYLRVGSPGGVSYQTFLAVADAPQEFTFPGGSSEWLMLADLLPFPIDWACRIRAVPHHAAMRSATRHQRELAAQAHEYEAEPAGPPPSLASAMDALDQERAELAAHPNEPELQVGMVYAVWAETLGELEQKCGWLQTILRGAEYHLPRPTGGQLDLFETMLPGASTPRVCHDYRQYLLPRDLAAGMPFAGAELGDRTGLLLGISRDAGCARPVLLDPAAGPRHDRGGSMAAFGTLGSGKSYLAKRLGAAVLLRGGQAILIDRTQAGEYVRFADAMASSGVRAQVVTIADGGQSRLLLDPLRVFDGASAAQAATGYLGLVCGTDPTSLEAATLARAVKQVQGENGQLRDVLGVLHDLAGQGDQYRHARELALRLEGIVDNRFGAPVWSDGPSLDTAADCTVIHLPHLAVPPREVLLSEHLSRRLLTEQVCSLGLLYLVAALARQMAYQHPDRFAALCLDEAWALATTVPGQQLLLDVVRDGRKHNAACWVLSQHPDDLPVELRDLISVRFVFGLTGHAAEEGLAWLGVEVARENLDLLESWAARRDPAADIAESRSPECLMRDPSGRIGRVLIAQAETDVMREGFESNPTRLVARPDDAHEAAPAELPPGPSPPEEAQS
jgi:AAA domain-containing protein